MTIVRELIILGATFLVAGFATVVSALAVVEVYEWAKVNAETVVMILGWSAAVAFLFFSQRFLAKKWENFYDRREVKRVLRSESGADQWEHLDEKQKGPTRSPHVVERGELHFGSKFWQPSRGLRSDGMVHRERVRDDKKRGEGGSDN